MRRLAESDLNLSTIRGCGGADEPERMMDERTTWWVSLFAFVGGTALWAATAIAGDRAEPWDSGLYWTVSYPFALMLSGAFGFGFPRHPWRWALLLLYSQLAVMLLSGAGLGLLPLGLILLGVLSLPALVVAKLGAVMRLRIEGARNL